MSHVSRTILLVEDNPDDAELTLRAFRKNRIHNDIRVARDGAEALAWLHDPPDEDPPKPLPSVILLDLKLPKIDGLEVLRRIRADARTRLLPVIILTSSNEDVDLMRGYELGANSYVRKPVDFGDFVEATHQLGMYWLVLNEPPPNVAR
jgi:two-component system response regulator